MYTCTRRLAPFALVVTILSTTAAVLASDPERSFERSFDVAGPVALDAVTRTGRVAIRAGGEGGVVVRGVVKRNVSWNGARVTDAAIDALLTNPPVRADGGTIRIERVADDAVWRGVSVDYEVVVPAEATIVITTESGAISVTGSRGDVRVTTGSGATRVDAESGRVDLRSESASLRVVGRVAALAMRTQSGAIVAEAESVGTLDVSSGSGSVTISGLRGTARAETGSSQIRLAGEPTGDWWVRSRSGSVELRVEQRRGFDVSARSRSGAVAVSFPVAASGAMSKHRVEGSVNGGGPKVDVETGSSQITIRP